MFKCVVVGGTRIFWKPWTNSKNLRPGVDLARKCLRAQTLDPRFCKTSSC